MEDIIKKELCIFCEGKTKENCMKIKLIRNGYTCENYEYNYLGESYIEPEYIPRGNT